LIDILDPCEESSLADYLEAAGQKMREIRERGRQVLFVGGTPLYLKGLLRGIYRGPPADWQFRREVEEETRKVGVDALHERLRQVDPLSAAKLHPNDLRRIIRALEVYKATGRPISHVQTHFDEGRPANQCKVYVLAWPRDILRQRIDARVDRMFASGLVDEVSGLLQRYRALGRTAAQAVGYREVIEHLHGQRTLPDTVALVKSRTRQFARRQETWFRSLSECQRIPRTAGADPAEVAEQIRAAAGENAP
jgi:tRNA dimethylallyltransferase